MELLINNLHGVKDHLCRNVPSYVSFIGIESSMTVYSSDHLDYV